MVLDERPSLRVGNMLRLDFRIKTQADWRDFPRVWTVGVNWYLNRFVKVQANLIRERREKGGIAVPGQERPSSPALIRAVKSFGGDAT